MGFPLILSTNIFRTQKFQPSYIRNNRILTCSFFVLTFFGQQANALNLNAALKETRKQVWEPKLLSFDIAQINSEAKGVDSAFNWQLQSSVSKTIDETPNQSQFSGDKREIFNSEIGMKKMFQTGTAMEFSISTGSRELTFDTTAPATAASPVPTINPEETAQVKLTVSQPLLRNYGAKLVDIKRELIYLKKIDPFFRKRIINQTEQGKTEQLYWKLAGIQARRNNIMKLVKLSKKFVKLMKKRERIGRADQVDVASAEAKVVNNEGLLLNLNVVRQLVTKQIFFQVYASKIPKSFSVQTPSLRSSPLKLPAQSVSGIHKIARKKRQDLQMLKAFAIPPKKQLTLVEEQEKPNLDLFVSASGNGLEEKLGDAFSDAAAAKNPSVTVGLKFNMKLGNSRLVSQRSITNFQVMKSEAQIQNKRHEIYRDIELAWLEKLTGSQQQIQANAHIRSLKRQRKAEKTKFKQARSGEIGVVRYDMEIIAADNGRISALETIRTAEAKLRLLSHSYPGAL